MFWGTHSSHQHDYVNFWKVLTVSKPLNLLRPEKRTLPFHCPGWAHMLPQEGSRESPTDPREAELWIQHRTTTLQDTLSLNWSFPNRSLKLRKQKIYLNAKPKPFKYKTGFTSSSPSHTAPSTLTQTRWLHPPCPASPLIRKLGPSPQTHLPSIPPAPASCQFCLIVNVSSTTSGSDLIIHHSHFDKILLIGLHAPTRFLGLLSHTACSSLPRAQAHTQSPS